ncbi:conserved hypothetical protein [Histoplasma capsulatum G186AR]|uniref:Vps72/YL1 C-terminal domain-containing protein n=1 Tax=Ajellomyces capsulatus (strain G186AR / H82 / ATCC MYA-2454 / RMSCC 2432) TaxID=447093 RepID=C0NPA4_AJECG|nr:uncharacterized protein HCBG_04984 [Histoplasma capsulatum G186AR]EEH06764.1 conserved hypothetical protein [Histoplasma capsulatum G186AR]
MAPDDSPMTSTSTSSDDEPVESLVEGRARRSTAGKNMGALLDAEADDELALLFAEEEDDEEFTSGDEGAAGEEGEVAEDEVDDMQLDSSSDDEDDQGPNAQEDELEGEKELERQARAERLARKRKEQDSMMKIPAFRKRVKINPTATKEASETGGVQPRPKKKSERVSWLPTPEDGPTRSSSRRQTMQNKELTHARLKDSEQRRVRLIATMEEAARRKEKLKPKVMTQQERLAEAAKTERLNSKSLNRWEQMERKRSAVATWWSGLAKWVNGKLTQVGTKEIRRVPEVEKKKKGVKDNDHSPRRGKSKKTDRVGEEGGGKTIPPLQEKSPDTPAGKPAVEGQTQETKRDCQPEQQITFTSPQEPSNFLDGIHIYAAMKDDTAQVSAISGQTPSSTQAQPVPGPVPEASKSSAVPKPPSKTPPSQSVSMEGTSMTEAIPEYSEVTSKGSESTLLPTKPENQESQKLFPQIEMVTRSEGNPAAAAAAVASPSLLQQQKDNQPGPPTIHIDENIRDAQDQRTQIQMQSESKSPLTHPPTAQPLEAQPEQSQLPIPTPPPTIEYSSRNLLILESFENKTPQEREEFNIFFNSRKPQKLQKITQELCPITSRPAHYRDPETKLPYANAVAYREIRQTLANRYAWSGLLGCFVGPIGVGARGVPERFLAPNAPPPPTAVLVGDDGNGGGIVGESGSGNTRSAVLCLARVNLILAFPRIGTGFGTKDNLTFSQY